MVDFKQKEKYDINDLLEIMRSLRAPGGCPWDAEQTHESIRKNLIEETYEVVEAIDKKDSGMLLEELGDLLMQVVFHAQMEDEKGVFNFDDVADGVCKKLIENGIEGSGNYNEALSKIVQMSFKMNGIIQDTWKIM